MLSFPRLFVALITFLIQVVRVLARSRADLVLENLVLRQQVATLSRERLVEPLRGAAPSGWASQGQPRGVRLAWPASPPGEARRSQGPRGWSTARDR